MSRGGFCKADFSGNDACANFFQCCFGVFACVFGCGNKNVASAYLFWCLEVAWIFVVECFSIDFVCFGYAFDLLFK